ncbi:DNA -binding domain-containing protein [Caulobacter segnis]|uniref:DNA -binding domain-containing protein n=1 Tax=Caulobacter segnis TaxID=88688 RepID=UPI002857BE08|nr:DUF2285 domain-containing protein [Caulobacter segnis]MDR6623871.1 hypothetical protein [Caulobacter segnis]
MLDEHPFAPDWRRADTYRPLLRAEAAVWAWEFARRGLARDARMVDVVDPPGLCYVGPGPAGDPAPAVLWRPDPSAAAVSVSAAPADTGHALDIAACDLPILVARIEDGDQQVLVCDGPRRLRLAVIEGDILGGPVTCRLALPLPGGASAALEGLRGLVALRDTGRLPAAAPREPARAGRWLESLRAHDARRAGASHREIATLLFGEERVREDWAGRSDYMRMRVQRLLRTADRLAAGGYRGLLGIGVRPQTSRVKVVEIWRSAAWRCRVTAPSVMTGIFLGAMWLCAGYLREPCGLV